MRTMKVHRYGGLSAYKEIVRFRYVLFTGTISVNYADHSNGTTFYVHYHTYHFFLSIGRSKKIMRATKVNRYNFSFTWKE